MERYNGWDNYDTWLVVVWLQNDLSNYEKLRRLNEDEVNDLDAMALENDYYYGDEEINWDNVNVNEIIYMLLEDK
jgi:hypothetical protein